ncbi:ABC transporter permease [Intestinicryptomonas porci]|uniref:ABC transporter permease n=1 Tax=Intestinicryptomonas porci TaxID=2926320 RepID=A0ABU4WFA3_9BACT|nr:ABC transporter permease [Opitutales bacterium CLA-KB-P66]
MADLPLKNNLARPSSSKSFVEIFLTMPTALWLVLFFVIPSILIFTIAFHCADSAGGIGSEWTLETVKRVASSNYVAILWRTIWVSAAVTVICILFAVPVGYFIACANRKIRPWLLLFFVLPLWTNFLIRIFAWRLVLHPDGFLRKSLIFCGMSDEVFLLNNMGAVIAVTVYTFLPFAILPVYAAAEKFNFALLEAARDLGASRFKAFYSVFIPGIKKGIITALLIVFVPALGSYAIPDLIGGVSDELIGNKIALRAMQNRNLPEAAAYAAVLAIIIIAPIAVWFAFNRKNLKSFIKARMGGER